MTGYRFPTQGYQASFPATKLQFDTACLPLHFLPPSQREGEWRALLFHNFLLFFLLLSSISLPLQPQISPSAHLFYFPFPFPYILSSSSLSLTLYLLPEIFHPALTHCSCVFVPWVESHCQQSSTSSRSRLQGMYSEAAGLRTPSSVSRYHCKYVC